MMQIFCACLAAMLLSVSAQAQTLPVRIHKEIKTFAGSQDRVIAVDGADSYLLASAHKEGGRAWADAIWQKRGPAGVTLLSRGYDCASDLYRWLGEASDFRGISLSVRSIDQTAYRRLTPGSIEYRLAAHVCAL